MSRKLQYFNFGGYAEAIRYMFHYGKLDFEDVRYNREDWPIQNVKDSLPYGQMPVYEENGRSLNQSSAIARYVASKVGLLPTDLWEQAILDAAVQNIYDMAKKLTTYMMDANPEKEEENKKNIDETLKYFLSRFEKELQAGNGHFGGKLTWADFVLVGIIETLNLYLKTSLENDYSSIGALITKINDLPGVKEYLANRNAYSL